MGKRYQIAGSHCPTQHDGSAHNAPRFTRAAFMTAICASGLAGCVPHAATSSASAASLIERTGAIAELWPSRYALVKINARDRFAAASVAKLLIGVALIERSAHALVSNRVNASGERLTRLLHLMIAESDNQAANLLLKYVGITQVNKVANDLGLRVMRVHHGYVEAPSDIEPGIFTTPSECNAILDKILTGARRGTAEKSPSAQGYNLLLRDMCEQQDRRFLRSAVPSTILLANKTGEIEGELNDVGIIDPFGQHPMLLSILCRGVFDFRDPIDYSNGVQQVEQRCEDVYKSAMSARQRYSELSASAQP